MRSERTKRRVINTDKYIAEKRPMTEYERGQYDMFELITSAYYGKQYYFLQDNGMVYSRACGKEITFSEAVSENMGEIGEW